MKQRAIRTAIGALVLVLTLGGQRLFGAMAKMDVDLEKYRPYESFVELKGGEFRMGINDRTGVNHEYPTRKAVVKPFRINLYPVTIASYKKFKSVKRHYESQAEKVGHSWVFRPLVDPKATLHEAWRYVDEDERSALKREMVEVEMARWNRPEGGLSRIKDRMTHPAVHVSYNDAHAYCVWKNMRLPTEIEWEYAARGGLKNKVYPWGDNWIVNRTNLWQGRFPTQNQMRDGHYGLAPVDAYPPQNKYEMYDVIGNVWEWTSTIYRDLFADKTSNHKRSLKGGSFMDTRDGTERTDGLKIRVAARIGLRKDYTAQNVGFRCAQSIGPDELKKIPSEGFRVVRLRPPMHFHLNHTHSHFLHEKRDEL